MPNHVHTLLICRGPKEVLDELKAFVAEPPTEKSPEGTPLAFERIIPQPPGLFEGTPSPIGGFGLTSEDMRRTTGRNWYEWNIARWGTKWGAYDVSLEEVDGELHYRFDTAWARPVPVLKELSRMFQNVTFDAASIEETCESAQVDCYMRGQHGRTMWIPDFTKDFERFKDLYKLVRKEEFPYDIEGNEIESE